VGNVSEHGLGTNGDTVGTGRRDIPFVCVPGDDIENRRRGTLGEKAGAGRFLGIGQSLVPFCLGRLFR
jgi:hypothetical protein